MAVTLLDALEYGLAEGHPRPPSLLGEGHRHQGLVPWGAIVLVPGEGEHQPIRLHHLAVDPALPQLLAVLVAAQAGAPAAARPEIPLTCVAV